MRPRAEAKNRFTVWPLLMMPLLSGSLGSCSVFNVSRWRGTSKCTAHDQSLALVLVLVTESLSSDKHGVHLLDN